ncbi:DEAD/DEAH box helicase [Flavobacterium sp. AG291]|uniref:DEAD/DEAH box helicase n=1 Tax=Flavobacterium sp. AG291 TaxID=2184000 RepID=UPI000E0C8D94|nr:DEAD/DEAH box helicase [Flavobacterium sp. AG291]RDI14426.1 ATP-dependent Lhr-like helicase [Flavobacterium sp. AG291]
MSFELLSEPIRKYIRDKRWEQLRPIQNAAISRILTTNNNYILASRTASGKTEAAFLPILSKVNFNEKGVQVLYISPLIALINDQFYRVEELCKNLEVNVVKWHGEANKTLKDRLIKAPSGVVLMTPESLEAMFVNKPYNVKQLFSNLKFVVIDEIHSFIGTDRGIQLKSLLSRLQDVNISSFNVIGLSATIGDYNEAKKFTGNESNTKVLLDKTYKEINAVFRYFKSDNKELSVELFDNLYSETKDNKVLIFPNSRGRAEEVAVKLKKISERFKGHPHYFSHHSSVDKEVREYVEYFAKNNDRKNFCIACTSTLELGIDIGNVDEVVQIDATHSISSLIQRVGRSGRKDGATSNLFLYATNQWSLLQSLACWLLYKEGYIEPPAICNKPYDLLLHQALSVVKGRSGIIISDLVESLKRNFAFKEIEEDEITDVLNYLIETDLLEKIQNEVIIGVEGEKIVNGREFYSVFKSEENFKISHAGNTIGEIPISPQIAEDENILLAAKIWKITFIDFAAKKIEVIPAKDGKAPSFSGNGGIVDSKIREKMLEILYSDDQYDILEDSSSEELRILRDEFSVFNIKDLQSQRPLLISEKHLEFYTFTGTKINRAIQLLLKLSGIDNHFDDPSVCFKINTTPEALKISFTNISNITDGIDDALKEIIEKGSIDLNSKWGYLLPIEYQIKLVKQKYYDFTGALRFLKQIEAVVNY